MDSTPSAADPFIDLLFPQQPSEGGAGLSDEQLTALAEEAGAGDAADCI